MPIISRLTAVLLLFIGSIHAQETHFVQNKAGLDVYSDPSLDSSTIAHLPFGSTMHVIKNSSAPEKVEFTERTAIGKWLKVEIDNSYYFINEKRDYFRSVGYVLDTDVTSLTQHANGIRRTAIGQEQFLELRSKCDTSDQVHAFVLDIDSINLLINNSVKWYHPYGFMDSLLMMESVQVKNDQALEFNKHSSDYGFSLGQSRYYPDFKVLEMEGGHDSDVCLNVRTGELHYTCGNPRYAIKSPNNSYQLIGYFGGQECISYFIQKRIGNDFSFYSCPKWMNDICLFEEFYWTSDLTFIYSVWDYLSGSTNKKLWYEVNIVE